MGNQTLVPSQIQSVDSYFLDLKNHIQFKQSLGSTTFMKTAKVVLIDSNSTNDDYLLEGRYLSGGGGVNSTTINPNPSNMTSGSSTLTVTNQTPDIMGSCSINSSTNETIINNSLANANVNSGNSSMNSNPNNSFNQTSSAQAQTTQKLTQHQLLKQRLQQLREQQQQVVVKIFPRYDMSIRLDLYSKRVREIKNTIYSRYGSSTNCLPFYELIITDKAAFLLRQFVKHNLYDRLSTRPFLTSIEKKWLSFQLLCAVNEIHSLQIVHGDMKTENVLVNSFLWVSLADLASYKPVYLSKNHPSADFNYYFDISRRRTCCLAPERLDPKLSRPMTATIPQNELDSTNNMGELMPPDPNDFKPQMDIFSLGCVLAEIFMERPLFDFAQLLAYRDKKYDPSIELRQEIGDKNVLDMIFSMLSLDPNERKSANEYLQEQSDRAFPSYFVYLKNYISRFINARLSADEMVVKLKNDLPLLLKNFKLNLNENAESDQTNERELSSPKMKTSTSPERFAEQGSNDAFLILLSLLLSYVRKIKFAENKLIAIDLMNSFSKFLDDSIILDRVLPYYLCLLDDQSQPRGNPQSPIVKSYVIYALNDCLSSVYKIDVQNLNIFPEIIFDCLERASKDESYLVRSAVAKTISRFALTSLRYLDTAFLTRRSFLAANHSQNNSNTNINTELDADKQSAHNQSTEHLTYDKEYEHYQMRITEIVMHLITEMSQTTSNASNAVKEALIRSDIAKLCSFFSRQKTSEFLLPHMITILNEKTDWSVRAAFFDALCPVLTCIGWESIEIVKSLLEQGLRDSEEFVIYRTLISLSKMVEIGLLDKQQICYFLNAHIASLLCHPSIWIRHGAVNFVCTLCKQQPTSKTPKEITPATNGLNTADILCSVAPTLSKFLSRSDLITYDRPDLLFQCLKSPLKRAVYDCIAQDMRSDQLFIYLAQRSEIRCLNIFNNQNYLPGYIDCADASVQEFFEKLCKLGFLEEDEDKLLQMKDFMDKTRISRLSSSLHNTGDLLSTSSSVLGPWNFRPPGENCSSLKDGYITIMRDKFQRCNVEFLNTKISQFAQDQLKVDLGTPSNLNLDQHRKTQQQLETGGTTSDKTTNLNTEWSLMFGQNTKPTTSTTETTSGQNEDKLRSRNSIRSSPNETPSPNYISQKQRFAVTNYFGQQQTTSMVSRKYTDCSVEVEKYLDRCKFIYEDHKIKQSRVTRFRDTINSSLSSNQVCLSTNMSKWKPRGYLVFNSNEHTRSIDRLSRNSDATYFSTCSTSDGCVKIWSTDSLLSARSGFYKSVFTYDRQSHDANASFKPVCTSFYNKHSLAILCEDFKFYVIDFNSDRTQYRLYSNERLFRSNGCKSFINNATSTKTTNFNKTTFYYLNRTLKPPTLSNKCGPRICYCSNNYPVEMIRIDDTSASWPHAAPNYYDYFLGNKSSAVKGLFCYSTSTGDFSCIDMRSRAKAFDVKRDLRRGYVTTMITDPWYTWLAMGTSNGMIEVYDFRFMIPVQSFEHRSRTSVAKLCTHPSAINKIVASYQGNNELCVWNMENQKGPEFVFWGVQSVPPLCQNKMSNAFISGIISVSSEDDSGTSGLICASSDMKMRYLDLNDPNRDSYIISSAFNFQQQNSKISNDLTGTNVTSSVPNQPIRTNNGEFASSVLTQNVTYETRQIEGTKVLLELDQQYNPQASVSTSSVNNSVTTNSPALIHQSYFTHHQDAISDLVVCYSPTSNRNQPLIVTAARDGTMKIWR